MKFYEQDLIASICKDSFYDFFREFWHTLTQEDFVENWHIKFLCDELQVVAERVFAGQPKEHDLLINISPGTTKSTIVSQMFPAWVWARMPWAHFICVSYAYLVALRDAIKSRDIVQSEKYQQCFPGIALREDQNTKGLYVNTKKGQRLSAGMDGTIMSMHGHFIIVDDPISPEASYSQADLAAANRVMTTTLPTRRIDKDVTVTIVVQQRLALGDPSDEMIERYKDSPGKLKHIRLPGELPDDKVRVSPPELRKFYKDGLFDPVRLSREALAGLFKQLGAYGYAGQILQDPVALGGGMFDVNCFQLTHQVTRTIIRKVRAWDKAATQGGGKFSSGILIGEDDQGGYWVLDAVRGQWSATQREDMIRRVAETDGYDVDIVVEIEGGSGGKESGETTIRNLAGFTVHSMHPTGSKESRAYPFASQVGAKNVFVLIRPWTREYLEETRIFRENARYTDQIDASGTGFNHIAKKPLLVGGWR